MSIGYVLCFFLNLFPFFRAVLVLLSGSLAVRIALYCLSVVRFTTVEQ